MRLTTPPAASRAVSDLHGGSRTSLPAISNGLLARGKQQATPTRLSCVPCHGGRAKKTSKSGVAFSRIFATRREHPGSRRAAVDRDEMRASLRGRRATNNFGGAQNQISLFKMAILGVPNPKKISSRPNHGGPLLARASAARPRRRSAAPKLKMKPLRRRPAKNSQLSQTKSKCTYFTPTSA